MLHQPFLLPPQTPNLDPADLSKMFTTRNFASFTLKSPMTPVQFIKTNVLFSNDAPQNTRSICLTAFVYLWQIDH